MQAHQQPRERRYDQTGCRSKKFMYVQIRELGSSLDVCVANAGV